MLIDTLFGDAFGIQADVISLPADANLTIDEDTFNSAGAVFQQQFNEVLDFYRNKKMFPLKTHTVQPVKKGDVLRCSGTSAL